MSEERLAGPAETPGIHRIAEADFYALAAGVETPAAAQVLQAGVVSQSKLRLAKILRLPDLDMPEPLAEDRSVALEVFSEVERVAPGITTDLLTHPSTGLWAAHTLRRAESKAHDPAPLWLHLGHINTLAAVAAIRANQDIGFPLEEVFPLRVPVNLGAVMLTDLGRAWVATKPYAVAEIRASATDIVVSSEDTTVRLFDPSDPNWETYHTITAQTSQGLLRLILDDIDPYGNFDVPFEPVRGVRLDETTVAAWQSMGTEAVRLLDRDHPQTISELVRGGLRIILPRKHTQRFKPSAASTNENNAAARLSLPDNLTQLALNLVHELAHSRLNRILRLFPLVRPEWMAGRGQHYSPWRDDPRPLGGHLHGTYANLAMTAYWWTRMAVDRGAAGRLAAFEFAMGRLGITSALNVFKENPEKLTEFGALFVQEMAKTAEAWQTDTVPDDVLALAKAATASHRSLWLAHHLRADLGAIDALLEAWRSKAACPLNLEEVLVAVHTDESAYQLDTKGLVARLYLSAPEEFEAMRRNPENITSVVPYASPADVALIAAIGDRNSRDTPAAHRQLTRAQQLYLAQLRDSPDDLMSLVGLGLTEQAIQPDSSLARILNTYPHIIRSLQARMSDTERQSLQPTALAAWLAKGLVG